MADRSDSPNATQAQRWNGESGRYWITHRERHLAGHQHLLPHLFRAAGISRGERVLDVGCGCGGTTITAARAARSTDGPVGSYGLELGQAPPDAGPGGTALGVDLSGPMLQLARRLATEAGLANARFVRGDAQASPLRPRSFDVMISSFGVLFFDDPAAAFAGLAATLRPRGRLAFLCWQHDLDNELFSIPLRAFQATGRLPGSAGDDLFADPRRISGLLSRAGWADIQIDPVVEPAWMGSDVADVMGYLRGMFMIRNLAAQLADQALTEQVLAGIAEQYATRQQPNGVWVRAAAWLVTGRRR